MSGVCITFVLLVITQPSAMQCQKALFQLPEEVAYLNCAYMSPQLRQVEAVGQAQLRLKNQPYRIQPADFFSGARRLRERFARLVGIADPQRVAIIPSASYGIANAARNIALEAGQQVVVAAEQFPSNYYPWQRLTEQAGAALRVVAPPLSERRGEAWNAALLSAIDASTAVVALSHVHWADGTRFDLAAIRQRTREVGALLIVDGTQSVGALPFDVSALQPDALICAGYKWLLGPYSVGVAYYGPPFDRGTPIEENWINRLDSEDFRGLVNYQERYQPGAGRYSVGEQSNFILVPMLAEALAQLLEWGVEHIQDYCRQLSAAPLQAIADLGGQVEADDRRCGHLFGVRLPASFDRELLKEQFAAHRVFVSLRGNAIRIAPHVYNDAADFDALLHCFKTARRKMVF